MAVEKIRVFGSSSIGVFLFACDKFSLAPNDAPNKTFQAIKDNLNVPVIRCKIYDSVLVGIFIAGNSKGILLPRFASEDEINTIRESSREIGLDITVERLNIKETALGNLILANDKAAIVSPGIPKHALRTIQDVLDVEVDQRPVAESHLVGAVAVVTNRGLLVHPLATDEEVDDLMNFFKIGRADVGTINRGSPFIRSGLVANVYGALVGEDTTGPELMRIHQVLF